MTIVGTGRTPPHEPPFYGPRRCLCVYLPIFLADILLPHLAAPSRSVSVGSKSSLTLFISTTGCVLQVGNPRLSCPPNDCHGSLGNQRVTRLEGSSCERRRRRDSNLTSEGRLFREVWTSLLATFHVGSARFASMPRRPTEIDGYASVVPQVICLLL